MTIKLNIYIHILYTLDTSARNNNSSSNNNLIHKDDIVLQTRHTISEGVNVQNIMVRSLNNYNNNTDTNVNNNINNTTINSMHHA